MDEYIQSHVQLIENSSATHYAKTEQPEAEEEEQNNRVGPPSPKLSLEEEAKLVFQDISSREAKTPMSVLHELLCQHGKTPKYELVQKEGAIHEPIFRYRVFLNSDYMATGTGRSKKDAKHSAAQKLLELLVGKITLEQANVTNGSPGKADITQVVSPYDDKVMGNPIGWLQEMCIIKRWPTPIYEMEHEEGFFHERQFTIACQVLKLKEIGTGKSKKLAKRMAAHKMFQALQDMPQEGSNTDLEEENLITEQPEAGEEEQNIRVTEMSKLENVHSPTVDLAVNRKKPVRLHGPPSPKLSLEEEAKLDISYISAETPVYVLQELLSQHGKTPKYELVQIEGAIHEPIFLYRVFLNSDYMATGTGGSKMDAKHSAAQILLELLVGKITLEEANVTNGSPGKADITQVVSPYDDKVMGNPIGWLQEMCMSKRWPTPIYEMEHEEGLPHERQFTIACQVLKLKEIGTGKSKKLAKRMAAHKMWQALQDMAQEGSNTDLEEENLSNLI